MHTPSGHLLLAQAALLESYGQGLPQTESCPVEALAAALAASPGWPSGCGAVLVVRQEPTPALAVLGCFSETQEIWLRGQIQALHKACGTLRYIDQTQVEADCWMLADQLRAHLGVEGIRRASLTGIPTGRAYRPRNPGGSSRPRAQPNAAAVSGGPSAGRRRRLRLERRPLLSVSATNRSSISGLRHPRLPSGAPCGDPSAGAPTSRRATP